MRMTAPSILAANFARMSEAIETLNASAADYIHCDVMDGIFVPNITFGQKMVADVKKLSRLPMDVHLMISRPEAYVEEFVAAGADIVTVHAEAAVHLDRVLNAIREAGAKAGVALNPATPPSALEYALESADLVLVMSVNPGFGGQRFIESSLRKIARIREMIDKAGTDTLIEVDGGIGPKNAAALYEAGADILVAGSAVFGAEDPLAAVLAIRDAKA